jgi:hypothetical protein
LKGTSPQELVRHPGEQTSAITAASIRVHTAPVRQADEGLQRSLHDLTRSRSAYSGDQADTAGIVVCGYMTPIHLYNVYRQ